MHTQYICKYIQNTYQYVLVCIEYIPIPPLRIGVCIETCIVVCSCLNPSIKHAIRTVYCQNTCLILTNTDWYVSIHTRHVSIHTLNTYRNTYQNTYQYGAVVLVRICTYQVSIRALHFPDERRVRRTRQCIPNMSSQLGASTLVRGRQHEQAA